MKKKINGWGDEHRPTYILIPANKAGARFRKLYEKYLKPAKRSTK